MRFLWAGPEVGHRTAEGICATRESPEVVPSSSPHLLTSQGLTPALPPTSPARQTRVLWPLWASVYSWRKSSPAWTWRCMPIPPAIGRQRQEFQARLHSKNPDGGAGGRLEIFFFWQKAFILCLKASYPWTADLRQAFWSLLQD